MGLLNKNPHTDPQETWLDDLIRVLSRHCGRCMMVGSSPGFSHYMTPPLNLGCNNGHRPVSPEGQKPPR